MLPPHSHCWLSDALGSCSDPCSVSRSDSGCLGWNSAPCSRCWMSDTLGSHPEHHMTGSNCGDIITSPQLLPGQLGGCSSLGVTHGRESPSCTTACWRSLFYTIMKGTRILFYSAYCFGSLAFKYLSNSSSNSKLVIK